ncbi:MAG: hypothetical protein KDD46_02915 [Bdellovibrionales bacterium]|nr:hypothetical protein [Bdellovibrionales bacterium]
MRNKYIIVILLGFFSFITACATVDLNGLDPDDFQGQIDDGGGDGNNLFADVDCDSIDSSFTTQVKPFFDTNCATGGCHSGSSVSGVGNVQLDATNTYSPSTIAEEITSGPGYDAFNVHQSLILLEPLASDAGGNADDHGGGEIFSSADDSDLEKIYCWLEGGLENDDDNDHNFGDDILRIIQDDYNCLMCHNNVNNRVDFSVGQTPAQAHNEITTFSSMVGDVVDVGTPANSLLLQNPQGMNGHQNYNLNAADLQAIQDWISAGAPFD